MTRKRAIFSRERPLEKSDCVFESSFRGREFKHGDESSRIWCRFSRREKNYAPISSHRDSDYGIEARGDPLERSETLCRQSPKKRIRRGMDALRSGCGGSRSGPASGARRVRSDRPLLRAGGPGNSDSSQQPIRRSPRCVHRRKWRAHRTARIHRPQAPRPFIEPNGRVTPAILEATTDRPFEPVTPVAPCDRWLAILNRIYLDLRFVYARWMSS